jgi:hypothetical protein
MSCYGKCNSGNDGQTPPPLRDKVERFSGLKTTEMVLAACDFK